MAQNLLDDTMGQKPDSSKSQAEESLLKLNDKGTINLKDLLQAYEKLGKQLEKNFNAASRAAEVAETAMTKAHSEVSDLVNKSNEKEIESTARKAALEKEKEKAQAEGNTSLVKKIEKLQKEDVKKESEETFDEVKSAFHDLFFNREDGLKQAFSNLGESIKKVDFNVVKHGINNFFEGIQSFRGQIDSALKTITNYKTAWNTRLDGNTLNHQELTDLVKNAVGVSPYIKQTTVFEKLDSAIDQGITYNVEQRAFLDTISDSISTTFEAFTETLNNLVRIQQEDSTAYRLGMEASLNEYLNRMFDNTEYLSKVSDTVTDSLYTSSSLLSARESIDYEYQIQKWLGSLYSVGFSSNSISNIAKGINALGSGDISQLDSGTGRLLVMAAANSGLDYAQMITDGLEGSEINTLMKSMVTYLYQISTDNKVVQTQLAKVFDLNTSDIEAVVNLSGLIDTIYQTDSNYSTTDASNKLNERMSTIGSRISMGKALQNLKDNLLYTLTGELGSNPALYNIYTLSNLMSDLDAEIAIPFVTAFGSGVDLETTVADLMRVGSIGASLVGSLGGLISGLSQLSNGILPAYSQFVAASESAVQIGTGFRTTSQVDETSMVSNTYVGNNSGDDIIDQQQAQALDQKAVQAEAAIDDARDIDDL